YVYGIQVPAFRLLTAAQLVSSLWASRARPSNIPTARVSCITGLFLENKALHVLRIVPPRCCRADQRSVPAAAPLVLCGLGVVRRVVTRMGSSYVDQRMKGV